jgi:GST-like protein
MQSSPQPEAKAKALAEVARVLGVLEDILKSSSHVAGDSYSIADIAHFGWIWRTQAVGASLDPFPSVSRWYKEMIARPAVATAIEKTLALA